MGLEDGNNPKKEGGEMSKNVIDLGKYKEQGVKEPPKEEVHVDLGSPVGRHAIEEQGILGSDNADEDAGRRTLDDFADK